MSRILDKINSPIDLRALRLEQLPDLAKEIRQLIIATIAKNGGHLAPNLGTVELTLALHYVFDTPRDKLIWDVGHQCYTHKIITGRRDRFSTIRQENGISGFCLRDESEFDCFTTGHSSSSISLALGMAEARDLGHESYKVVAIIGDGALTGGVALEALNHAGDIKTPFLVVLNDNEMSIDHNVGALNSYLSHIRSNPRYSKAKAGLQGLLDHIPWLGQKLIHIISIFKDSIKSLLVPGMFFEDLGFTYLGPTDGHNIPQLVEILRRAAAIQKPVLLHVLTTKGKGYRPAEDNPHNWHGVEPFEIESGLPRRNPLPDLSFTAAFGETLINLAKEDPRIIAITAAMTEGTGLTTFQRQFPERFYDVGIAEQHALTFAAGLASAGKRPVVAIYSSFLQRAYDQIIEDICLQQLPVVMAIDRAGIVGSDGYTHQGIFDVSYLRSIPGLTIMCPADTRELQAMLRFAVRLGTPVAIRYPKGQAYELPMILPELRLGKAEIIREGTDLAFFALGSMVSVSLDAATLLSEKGIKARVINARFAAPLDTDTLRQTAGECQGRVVSIEENVLEGGFGAACHMALADTPAKVMNVALPHDFIPHGSREVQLERFGLCGEKLANRVLNCWFRD